MTRRERTWRTFTAVTGPRKTGPQPRAPPGAWSLLPRPRRWPASSTRPWTSSTRPSWRPSPAQHRKWKYCVYRRRKSLICLTRFYMCSYVFCNKKDAHPLFQGWITFWQTDRLIFYAVRKTRTDAKLHSDEANKNSFTFDRTLKLICILAFLTQTFFWWRTLGTIK